MTIQTSGDSLCNGGCADVVDNSKIVYGGVVWQASPFLFDRYIFELSFSMSISISTLHLFRTAFNSKLSPRTSITASVQVQKQQLRKMTTAKLNNGASIPVLGFGTWQDKDDQEVAVLEALKAGYKHIDTARGKRTKKFKRIPLTESSLWH